MAQHGVTVFHSLANAIHSGFQVYDKTSEGYLVRRSTGSQWELALVILKP